MTTTQHNPSIRRIKITNFKQIKNLDLALDPRVNILVGDNEAGKTTILEAIALAATGRFRGVPIGHCLSEYLFNRDAVKQYIDSVNAHNGATKNILPEPPKIKIEVFLNDCENIVPNFQGNDNSESDNAAFGYCLIIGLDEDFKEEYEQLLKTTGKITNLPIEYYSAKYFTFADGTISTRAIPLKTAVIDPSSELLSYHADSKAVRTLCDSIEDKQVADIVQEYRKALTNFQKSSRIKHLSEYLAHQNPALKNRNLALDVNTGTKDSWQNELEVTSSGIPYANIGSGMQCFIQSEIALSNASNKGVNILLIEEPENHLSFSRLNEYVHHLEQGSKFHQLILTTHSNFIANKLGLDNIRLVSKSDQGTIVRKLMADDNNQTSDFFRRLPGYDTLRFILCKAAILVEGPSDELIVQRAYKDKHGKLPIEDGIDVISTGLSFNRFLPLANQLQRRTAVITDNDGHPDVLVNKYEAYCDPNKTVFVSFERKAHGTDTRNNPEFPRSDTLEATLLRENTAEKLSKILGRPAEADEALLTWMEKHKTENALIIFNSSQKIKYPDYIEKAIDHVSA